MKQIVCNIRNGDWIVVDSQRGIDFTLCKGGPVTVNGGPPLSGEGTKFESPSPGSYRVDAQGDCWFIVT